MNLDRRGFLSSIAAALSLDPERLLWVPGTKLISIPKPRTVILPAPVLQVALPLMPEWKHMRQQVSFETFWSEPHSDGMIKHHRLEVGDIIQLTGMGPRQFGFGYEHKFVAVNSIERLSSMVMRVQAS